MKILNYQPLVNRFLIVAWYFHACKSAVTDDALRSNGCNCEEYQSTRIARVYQGEDAVPGDFPWQVSVQEFNKYGTNKWDHICGGTLISDRHVLTAKHCMGLAAKNYRVIAGTVERVETNPANTFTVSEYKYYPQMDRVMYEHDLAILKIQSNDGRIKCSDTVKPVCLGNATLTPSTICVVSGWGETENSAVSDTLQYAKLPVHSHEVCAAIWNNRTEISFDRYTASMICAGPLNGGRDSCLGDSGGPLVCIGEENHLPYLTGIVSWSTACGRRPSVYSRVSVHQWWIDEELNSN